MNTMHGSKRTAKTKKRTAPLERSRTRRQKPRRTNNEEFALPILPPVLPRPWLRRLPFSRAKSNMNVYLHIDRELLTHEARTPLDLSLLLGSEAFSARQPGRAVLTRGDLTQERRGGFDE